MASLTPEPFSPTHLPAVALFCPFSFSTEHIHSWACSRTHLSAPLQNVENFTLAQDEVGNVLQEDGKGRCPFDPNFKSTALVVGECWGLDGLTKASCGGRQKHRAGESALGRVGPRPEL